MAYQPEREEYRREEIDRLIARGDVDGLLKARGTLVDRKKAIETQLAEDKLAMQEDRSGFLDEGMDPRLAQVKASANSNHDWRGRAIAAQGAVDGQLAKIKAALQRIRGTEQSQKQYAVHVLRGTADEVADALRVHLSGDMGFQLLSHDGAVLLVTRI